jgi:hypothetical protein
MHDKSRPGADVVRAGNDVTRLPYGVSSFRLAIDRTERLYTSGCAVVIIEKAPLCLSIMPRVCNRGELKVKVLAFNLQSTTYTQPIRRNNPWYALGTRLSERADGNLFA